MNRFLRSLAPLRRISWTMLVAMLLLTAIGVAFVYSACLIREEASLQRLYLQHAQLAAVALVGLLALACIDFRSVLRWSPLFYLASILLLVAVLAKGEERLGAQRWIFGIQPSELAKIATILLLARFLGRKDATRGPGELLLAGLFVAIPAGLILLQPDIGTALVMAPVLLAMLFAAGTAPKTLLCCVLAALLLAGGVLGSIAALEKPDLDPALRKPLSAATSFLDDYQRKRLLVYLYPERDPHGMAWNKRQSEIAVGSGGRTGKGFLKGDQNLLGYLPQQVSFNDFIFSVLAEETGFRGAAVVLLLFLCILLPGLWTAARSKDAAGRLLCVGVVALIASHVFVNIAMTVGMVPITGLPLPFISYGRTFLLSMYIALGLVQSVAAHRDREDDARNA
ncbi:MAG: rod shape-determining protein RodA [Kiritimatiellia bacterium]|jgi:rod shape determining protein RodA